MAGAKTLSLEYRLLSSSRYGARNLRLRKRLRRILLMVLTTPLKASSLVISDADRMPMEHSVSLISFGPVGLVMEKDQEAFEVPILIVSH